VLFSSNISKFRNMTGVFTCKVGCLCLKDIKTEIHKFFSSYKAKRHIVHTSKSQKGRHVGIFINYRIQKFALPPAALLTSFH
jgi:hypothetical protein